MEEKGKKSVTKFSQSNKRIRLMAVSPGFQSQDTGLGCFTSWYLFLSAVDKPAMSQDYNPLILPALVTLETLGMPNSILGSQEVDLP